MKDLKTLERQIDDEKKSGDFWERLDGMRESMGGFPMITLTDDERRALELIREHRTIYRATHRAPWDSPEWHRLRKKLAANRHERNAHINDKSGNIDPKYDRIRVALPEQYGYTVRSWNMDLLDEKREDDE